MVTKQAEKKKLVHSKSISPRTGGKRQKDEDLYSEKAQKGMSLAIGNYQEARQGLEIAAKDQEQQAREDYKRFETRYQNYTNILDQAFKNRESGEQQALEVYRQTIEKAGKTYRKTLELLIRECQQTTDNAWQSSIKDITTNRLNKRYQLAETLGKAKESILNLTRENKERLFQKFQRTTG